jgi:hypothetical protein
MRLFVHNNYLTATEGSYGIVIYANPATSVFTLRSKESINNIILYGIDGRIVKSLAIERKSLVAVAVNDLSAGIYFIEINRNSRLRFVKQ